MRIKTLILAGAAALSLAAPAAALADPYWVHDGGRRDHWGDRDDWRRHEWREHERWEHRGYVWGYGRRCFVENRGYYTWYGDYIYRPVRICR